VPASGGDAQGEIRASHHGRARAAPASGGDAQGEIRASHHGRARAAPASGGDAQGEIRASYYSRALAGRRTASGEPYDPRLFTAAHRTLPLGTILRVTRLPAGPSVEVRVNDRCGCTNGRQIDLSEAAARKLGMLRAGVVRVRLEVLGRRTRNTRR
jgi:rare lipoprotein A